MKMIIIGKYWTIVLVHSAAVALVLKLLYFILPEFVTEYYTWIANIFVYVLIARYTLAFTKKRYLSQSVSHENKAVLITGCDSGFGNELARRLDSRGYRVFASCLLPDGDGAQGLRESSSSGRLSVLGLDVTSDASVKDAVHYVRHNLGSSVLWAVVNNAGLHRGAVVELSSMDDFKTCLEVNSLGTVRVTRAFLPLLRRARGRVVNLASLAGRMCAPWFSCYSMSKYASVAFSECLRFEMDVWGVKVITVDPELFKTTITNPDVVTKCMKDSFAAIDDDVKEDYGDKFHKDSLSIAEYGLNFLSSPKLHKVLEALVDAVDKEHPDLDYHPCRNIFIRFVMYIYVEVFPHRLKVITCRIILRICRFPKPVGCK